MAGRSEAGVGLSRLYVYIVWATWRCMLVAAAAWDGMGGRRVRVSDGAAADCMMDGYHRGRRSEISRAKGHRRSARHGLVGEWLQCCVWLHRGGGERR